MHACPQVSLLLLLCISAAAATSPAALLLGGHINSQDTQVDQQPPPLSSLLPLLSHLPPPPVQVKSSVSELVPAGKCSPPTLPEGRAEISASVGESVIICGGMNKENLKGMASCIEWKMGSDQWVDKFTMRFAQFSLFNLTCYPRKARYGHQHWEPASRPGTVLLFGGWNEEENGGTTSGEEQPSEWRHWETSSQVAACSPWPTPTPACAGCRRAAPTSLQAALEAPSLPGLYSVIVYSVYVVWSKVIAL